MKTVFFILLVFLLIFIDQVLKYMVLSGLRFKWRFFEITLVYNEGSAFGIKLLKNNEYIIVNSLILSLLTIFIIHRTKKNPKYSIFYQFCLLFLLAGGIGNIIDRIIHGKVIDFIYFHNFPVFNIADVFISIGMIIFIMTFLIEERSIK